MKAIHCDECQHATVRWFVYRGPPAFDILTCAKRHKPRFYKPGLNPHYAGWGWKRVGKDFTKKEPTK